MIGKLLSLLALCVFFGLVVASCMAILYGGHDEPTSASEAPPTPDRLTIINYNILHGLFDEDKEADNFDRFPERLRLLTAELKRIQPDVIVLQEVVLKGPRGYPDVQKAFLSALGPEYKPIFGDRNGSPIGEGDFGQMILTKLPIDSATNITFFPGRAIIRTTLKLEHGYVEVYDVHLEGPEHLNLQAAEIRRVVSFIESVQNFNPVILTGDFNSRPADFAIIEVLKAGFVDVLAAKHDVSCVQPGDPGCTRATKPNLTSTKGLQDIRIDYMFGRGSPDRDLRIVSARPFMNQAVKNEKGDMVWLSDHIGIQATLEIVPRSGTSIPLTAPAANR